MATIFSLLMTIGEPSSGTLLYALGRALWGLWSWCWVQAIPGLDMKHLNVNKPILSYANEAVLPFYILHHPVLLSIGYFVVRWAISGAVKFAISNPDPEPMWLRPVPGSRLRSAARR